MKIHFRERRLPMLVNFFSSIERLILYYLFIYLFIYFRSSEFCFLFCSFWYGFVLFTCNSNCFSLRIGHFQEPISQ